MGVVGPEKTTATHSMGEKHTHIYNLPRVEGDGPDIGNYRNRACLAFERQIYLRNERREEKNNCVEEKEAKKHELRRCGVFFVWFRRFVPTSACDTYTN